LERETYFGMLPEAVPPLEPYRIIAGDEKIDAIGAFLASRDWVDTVVPPAELASVGQAPHHGLAFAISLKSDDAPNPFGVRGHSYESKPVAGKATHLHCGQHGGLAKYEQMPFLMVDGEGFAAGATSHASTSPIDLAPTILAHLQLPAEGMDGRGLQGANSSGGPSLAIPEQDR
jgi:hypothetical protein